MATIFEKSISENALVLEPRESLVYPFNLGDWNEIRIGFEGFVLNATGDLFISGGNKNEMVEEFYSKPIPTNTIFWFGLKEQLKQSNILPLQSGNNFIGFYTDTGYNSIKLAYPVGLFSTTWPGMGNQIAVVGSTATSNGTQTVVTVTAFEDNLSKNTLYNIWNVFDAGGAGSTLGLTFNRSGTNFNPTYSNYVVRNGLKISTQNKNLNGQTISVGFLTNQSVSMPGMTGLRVFLSDTSPLVTATGFYTSGYTSTGYAIPIPNNLFVYNPFLNNRICISNLLIEKYS